MTKILMGRLNNREVDRNGCKWICMIEDRESKQDGGFIWPQMLGQYNHLHPFYAFISDEKRNNIYLG